MSNTEQHPAQTGHRTPEQANLSISNAIVDEDTQFGRVLAALAKGHSLNKFDAENIGDHNLNTAISSLRIRHSIIAERKWEKLRGYRGRPTRVMRYWLNETDLKTAKRLLGWLL